MAKIEIESAFVEPWSRNEDQHPAWGMKTAEPHSRKNEAGKYETVGRTLRTVKVSRASGIDLTEFRKGDRVSIWGNESTESREYEVNGVKKKAYDLVLWADRIERVSAAQNATTSAPADEPWATAQPGAGDVWNAPVVDAFGDSTPF